CCTQLLQPPGNFSYFYFACLQNAIRRMAGFLQSLASRARYFQSFYRAPFFRLTEITFRLPALFDVDLT
ncbi:hypothetical protein, partial [Pseudomonas aeruginosa]|uniref:hypothetical protein n=1 Tax=Pseudomonas aeruginosa TaxID=287 RepID=UPI001ABC5582